MKPNMYKIAPTWLTGPDGSRKLYETQEEVDDAWERGWYGPPWLKLDEPLLSEQSWRAKRYLIRAVEDDPRYKGLDLNSEMTLPALRAVVADFEKASGMSVPDENADRDSWDGDE